MTSTLKAVLFDMDDTLIDWSKPDWKTYEREHLQRVLDYINRDVHPLDATSDAFFEAVRHYSSKGWADSEHSLRAPSHAHALYESLVHIGVPAHVIDINACLDAFDWQTIPGVTLFPEVPDVLKTLLDHGVRLGVVTNASVPMRLRDRELEGYALLHYFSDCRFSANDVGFVKPHPAIFQCALDCLGVRPAEAVFIGDNPIADVIGAQRVGMRAVLRLLDGRTQVRPADGFRPDGVVSTLRELLPLLDTWFAGWRSTIPARHGEVF